MSQIVEADGQLFRISLEPCAEPCGADPCEPEKKQQVQVQMCPAEPEPKQYDNMNDPCYFSCEKIIRRVLKCGGCDPCDCEPVRPPTMDEVMCELKRIDKKYGLGQRNSNQCDPNPQCQDNAKNVSKFLLTCEYE